ncbi:conserved exported hypothetical protein [Tenacibaculum amylolyticum]
MNMLKTKVILKQVVLLSLGVFLSCTSCSNNNEPPAATVATDCDFNTLTVTSTESYAFNTPFDAQFSQSSRWNSNAEITVVNEKGELTATDNSSILEAWKLFRKQMPYNKSWEVAVDVNIPLYWNSNGGNQAQVGFGVFAGKPVASGQSSKVYECNMAAINGGMRFVQAQLVANRLGEDPIDVQFKELAQSKESARLKIQFCSSNKTLSLFIDNTIVGKGQAINANGIDNWSLTDNDVIDVGIMGFAENTTISSNKPTLDNFEYKIY